MSNACGVGRFVRHRTRWAATILGLSIALTSCAGSPNAAPEPSYGSLPTFLPTASLRPDGVLIGTVGRPALTTEGDAVQVRMAQGTVLATVAGPEVPGEGLPHVSPSTACTWTVTLTAASARIPLLVEDFTSTDHFGKIYHPVVLAGTRPPPAILNPGQSVSFKLRAVMITGEGLMRWAPMNQVLASWDFEVETD